MNKLYLFIFFILLNLAGVWAQKPAYLPGVIVLKLKPQVKGADQLQTANLIINQVIKEPISEMKPMFPVQSKDISVPPLAYQLNSIYKITLADSKLLNRYISQLNQLREVEYAQLYYLPEPLGDYNDPYLANEYYFPLVHAIEAHQLTQGDTNVVIGIVDTGVDLYHEDLKDNFKYNYNDPINGIDDDYDGYIDNFRGWDLGDNDNNPQSLFDHHGTQVAGMASAVTNNLKGIASVGYHTKLLPIKVINSQDEFIAAYEGIVYAADHGCQIINCSWGSTVLNPLCDDVINYAVNYRNCLVVAAAGNARTDKPYYPASCKYVLSVAATNSSDFKWSNSTYGINVDICAPGEAVLMTNYNNTYIYGWGTSYASPLVCGAAALLKAYRPELNPLQLAEQLRISADIIDTLPDNLYYWHQMGHGRLNVYKALTDSTLPSLRISGLEVVNPFHSAVMPGDSLLVSFSVTNYLAQATNTTLRLTSSSGYLEPLDNVRSTGEIGTMEARDFSSSPITCRLSSDVPYDYKLRLNFDLKGEGYDDYQQFDVMVNPSYLDIQPNRIATSVTSNGKIGTVNPKERFGQGFIFNSLGNLLYEGGLILAHDNQHIASSVLDESDFAIVQRVDTQTVSDLYLTGNSIYQPVETTGLNQLVIKEQAKGFFESDLSSCIFYYYSIYNTGDEVMGNLHTSIYTDWDIDNYFANMVNYVSDLNLLYTYSHTTQVLYTGICFLSGELSVPYAFDKIKGGNGGLDITDGFSDDQKWYAINNARPTAGNEGDSIDVASMLSSGPYTLDSHDSLTLVYALIAGETLYDLKETAIKAKEKYLRELSIYSLTESKMVVYPNPVHSILNLQLSQQLSTGRFIIYNQMGILMQSVNFNSSTLSVDVHSYPSGIYYLQVVTGTEIKVKKIVIVQ